MSQMSRQRKYQLKALSEGRCQQCGRAPLLTKSHCEECAEKRRQLARKRTGAAPWRPGGKGRPPFRHHRLREDVKPFVSATSRLTLTGCKAQAYNKQQPWRLSTSRAGNTVMEARVGFAARWLRS